MSNEAKLGTIPGGNEGRDAVHIAIMPVQAGEVLIAGCPVRLNDQGKAIQDYTKDALGVVDPFLPDIPRVTRDSWFWLCLFPKTITGLRHVWEHPSLPLATAVSEPVASDDKAASEAWLNMYVRCHCPHWENEPDGGYSEFLRYVKNERWIFYNGSDCHSLADVAESDELFRHLSVVLERRIDASYFEAFTCTC